MPTNANTFNSRVTSESLEKKFRDVFPAQGGAELVQDLFASGVIQPVVDFSSVAEGSVLPQNLQTAWDFSTGFSSVRAAATTIVNNAGFWQVSLTSDIVTQTTAHFNQVLIDSGITQKVIWKHQSASSNTQDTETLASVQFVVFVRTGDSIVAQSSNVVTNLQIWYRQIADVNGNLVNPLGFTFS